MVNIVSRGLKLVTIVSSEFIATYQIIWGQLVKFLYSLSFHHFITQIVGASQLWNGAKSQASARRNDELKMKFMFLQAIIPHKHITHS